MIIILSNYFEARISRKNSILTLGLTSQNKPVLNALYIFSENVETYYNVDFIF